jgi:hypothetical protein
MREQLKSVRVMLLGVVLSIPCSGRAQTFTWAEITSSYALPAGIRVFQGDRAVPLLRAWMIDVDLTNPLLAVRPYIGTGATAAPFLESVGALAGVNGGFFGGGVSYSAVVYPNELRAQNIQSVTRSNGTYTVTRSFFGLDVRRQPSVHWIYHFSPSLSDLYRFAQPTQNTPTVIAPAPIRADGVPFDSLLAGIGGGPTLVKGGLKHVTYDEEAFFGSGVSGELQNPRTAVGYTSQKHVVMLVADGRQAASNGVTLDDLAGIMISLGCLEAMNLDGGGSTQMAARTAAGYQYVDVPSESRAVPTVFAVVYADSLAGSKIPTFEKIIDTGDPACTLLGGGWSSSANPGWWGTTPTQLAPISAAGDRSAVFRLNLPRPLTYELFAWWVAASNRATDTPFIVRHAATTDTVRVNQSANGSMWQKIGTFAFAGDTTDAVIVSNAATTGSYVCADAIRLVSYDPLFTAVAEDRASLPSSWTLEQNFPNPFNPSTTIRFTLPFRSPVRLAVYDLLGREVTVLTEGEFPPGSHAVWWDASAISSGVYFYRLSAGNTSATRSMVLVK